MKRALILFVGLVLLLNAGMVTFAAQTSDHATTFTSAAYVWAGPGPEYQSMGTARAGQSIRLDGRNFNGNWVRGLIDDGRIGWVSSGAVRLTYGELVGLVIIDVNQPFTLTGTVEAPAQEAAAPVEAAPVEAAAPAEVPAEAAPPQQVDGIFTLYFTHVASVFSGPGPEYQRLGVARIDTSIQPDGRSFTGGWIRGLLEDGRIGWVSSGATNITARELTGLIIIDVNTPFSLERTPPMSSAPAPAAAGAATTTTRPAATTGSFVLLPNVDPRYDAGRTLGERLNPYQGDHAALLYPMEDSQGNPMIHIYRIVGEEGRLIMAITTYDLAPFLANLPAQATLIKYEEGEGRYGPAALFVLPDGTLQFNIGPDDEGRTQVMLFTGLEARALTHWYVTQ